MKKLSLSILLVLMAYLHYGQQLPMEEPQPRTPLLEVLTSSTCPPCNQGNKDIRAVMNESDGNWTCVKYQLDFPGAGDPYFTDEAHRRSVFYNITGVPTLQIDGTIDVYPGNFTLGMLQEAQNTPSRINLDATYRQEGKTIEVSVNIEPTQNVLTPFLKLFVAIVENKTFKNVGTNGETEFEFVMKKMVPDANGTSLSPPKVGEPQHFTFSYDFKGDYRLPNDASDPIDHETEHSVEEFSDLSVVAWVQNRNTGEILQSTWAGITTASISTDDPTGNGIIAVFPNPAKEYVFLHYLVKEPAYCVLTLSDLKGNRLRTTQIGSRGFGNHMEKIDLSLIPEGPFLLSLEMNDLTYSYRLIRSK
jgi:hypothetical protein